MSSPSRHLLALGLSALACLCYSGLDCQHQTPQTPVVERVWPPRTVIPRCLIDLSLKPGLDEKRRGEEVGEKHTEICSFRIEERLSGAAHSCGAGVLNEAQLLSKTRPSITHCSVTARCPRFGPRRAAPRRTTSERECEENVTEE